MTDSNSTNTATYESISNELNSIFWMLDKYVFERTEIHPNDGKKPWEREINMESGEFVGPFLYENISGNKELMSDPELLIELSSTADRISHLAEELSMVLNAAACEAEEAIVEQD